MNNQYNFKFLFKVVKASFIVVIMLSSCGKDNPKDTPEPTKSIINGTGITTLLNSSDDALITNGTITYQAAAGQTNIPTTLKSYNTNSNTSITFSLPAFYGVAGSSGQAQYTETASAPGYETKVAQRSIRTGVNATSKIYLEKIAQIVIDTLKGSKIVYTFNTNTNEALQGLEIAMRSYDNATIADKTTKGITGVDGKFNFEDLLVYIGEQGTTSGKTAKYMLSWKGTDVLSDSLELVLSNGVNSQSNIAVTPIIITPGNDYSEQKLKILSDITGKAMVGALVDASIQGHGFIRDTTISGVTDNNGELTLKVISGQEGNNTSQATYDLKITHENANELNTTQVFVEGVHSTAQSIDLVHILLDTYSQYIAKAVDGDGDALEGATAKITLTSIGGSYTKNTNSNGETDQFSILLGQTPKGEVSTLSIDGLIELSKTNHEGASKTKTFTEGDMGFESFILNAIATQQDTTYANGYIQTKNKEDNSSIQEVLVSLRAKNADNELFNKVYEMVTDNNGRVQFNDIPVAMGELGTLNGVTKEYWLKWMPSASEFKTDSMIVVLNEGNNGFINALMTPIAGLPQHQDIIGIITDGNNNYAAKANKVVELTNTSTNQTTTITTGNDGKFNFENKALNTTYRLKIFSSDGEYGYDGMEFTTPSNITVESDTADNRFGAVLYDKLANSSAQHIIDQSGHGTRQQVVKYYLGSTLNDTQKTSMRGWFGEFQSDEDNVYTFEESASQLSGTGINISAGTYNTTPNGNSFASPFKTQLGPVTHANTTMTTSLGKEGFVHEIKQAIGLSQVTWYSVMRGDAPAITAEDTSLGKFIRTYWNSVYQDGKTFIDLNKIIE